MSLIEQSLTEVCVDSILNSIAKAKMVEAPYWHATQADVLPKRVVAQLQALPFVAQDVGDVSGKRELHNDTRTYFDVANRAKYRVVDAVAQAFQHPDVIDQFELFYNLDLTGTYTRLEYAQDKSGFWLQPHTDLGVKKFTFLLYLSDGPGHQNLGTDVYSAPDTWHSRPPFVPNTALVFVPGDNTWHGFEKREFVGTRQSVILNYVTADWREKGQLSFPDKPVK